MSLYSHCNDCGRPRRRASLSACRLWPQATYSRLRSSAFGRIVDSYSPTGCASAIVCQVISSKRLPVFMLGDRCATFDPITGVDVADTIEIFDDRVVDVAADDAIGIVALGLFNHDDAGTRR